ncbi:MAG TPA: hypothetical protein VE174_14585 [Actinomycetota bacterium]|nr:hypothetical protein [Actinomycetota bacterium]
MSQAFCDRMRDRGAPRTWAFVGADLVHSVPKQIMEASLMNQKWMAIFTAIASVALITALGMGIAPPVLLAAGTVALVGFLLVVSSKRGDRPTEYLYAGHGPKTWTWWTVLAALLATVYVVAATGQLIETPKATNIGALGIAIGFAGLIAMGLRLRTQSKITGNWMVIFATAPALMFFWMLLPPLVALAIIVGAVIEIARATPQTPAAA